MSGKQKISGWDIVPAALVFLVIGMFIGMLVMDYNVRNEGVYWGMIGLMDENDTNGNGWGIMAEKQRLTEDEATRLYERLSEDMVCFKKWKEGYR